MIRESELIKKFLLLPSFLGGFFFFHGVVIGSSQLSLLNTKFKMKIVPIYKTKLNGY